MAGLLFKNGKVQDLTLILSTRDYQHLGQLTGVKNVHYAVSENAPNELSFTVTKHDLNKTIWEQLEDFKLVWVKETNEYFQVTVSTTDSLEVSKTVTGTPIPEAELSQILLTAEINTDTDIKREDYEATTFYNESNPNASLLHRVLRRAPGYTIAYVDNSLKEKQRTFSIGNSTIYDFLMGECATEFHCVFKFDSADRSISAYDLDTYGTDTSIYIDKNNLTDSINLSVNTDSVKNCFKLVAGDEPMTAAVRMLNPAGSDYLYHIPEYLRKDMPNELKTKLEVYEDECKKYSQECETLTAEIYKLYDEIAYLTSGMMPSAENAEVTATSEAGKLTVANLSPLALSVVSPSTSKDTVHTALLNLARVYVRTGYVKLEIDTETEKYKPDIDLDTFINDKDEEEVTKDVNGFHSFTWRGRFKITNYSNKEDVVYSDLLTITVNDNVHTRITQDVLKKATQDDETGSVLNVLSEPVLDKFKKSLKEYSFNRLVSFSDAIKTALDTLESMEQADSAADLYQTLYVPYQDKRKAMGIVCTDCGRFIEDCYDRIPACPDCHSTNLTYGELITRHTQIQEQQAKLDERLKRRQEIQEKLDLETILGEYYPLFCSYRREDVYENSNYFSDGLSNEEIIARAKNFLEVATLELLKASEQQVSITATLYNLLLMPEFAPLLYSTDSEGTKTCLFDVGSWLRIGIDGVPYTLRLQRYSIDFDNEATLNVEFSNVVSGHQASKDMKAILDSAKSMATSYGYVAKQVDKGVLASEQIQDWMQNGLNSAHMVIKNNDNEEVIYTKHGILCRSYDDTSGTYGKEQVKLTHNCIVYTDDNWQSVKMALGKHTYRYYDEAKKDFIDTTGYGVGADFVSANAAMASPQIIGGTIYSGNYSDGTNGKEPAGTYINLNTGEFSFGGESLYYKGREFVISDTVIGKSIEAIDIKAEKLHIDAGNIDGILTAEQIDTKNLSVKSAATAESVAAENITGTTIKGKTIEGGSLLIGNKSGSYAEITRDGTLNCAGGHFTGIINATNGDIGGWKIGDYGIYNDNAQMGLLSNVGDTSMFYAGITLDRALEIAEHGLDTYPPFMVTKEGNLWCSNITIMGEEDSLYALYVSGDVDVWGNISVNGVRQHSKAEYKKNIEKLHSGLDIINNIDIYKFNYKTESDDYKKHIGLIIGDDYNYSHFVTSRDNDSVDIYSLISVCVKAIQELNLEIKELKEKIDE